MPCSNSDLRLIVETKTRGIPKNLIGRLQARLQQTEALLRLLLDITPDDKLRLALSSIHDVGASVRPGAQDHGGSYAWDLYPLTGLEDVRAWQRQGDCRLSSPSPHQHEEHSQDGQRLSVSQPEQSTASPVHECVESRRCNQGNIASDLAEDVSLPRLNAQSVGSLLLTGQEGEVEPLVYTQPNRVLPSQFQREFLW